MANFMITVKVFKLPHPVVTKVYMVYRGQREFVSWIFTSCKKLHCSENTCITVMVGNQTTIFFSPLQNNFWHTPFYPRARTLFQKQNHYILTKQENERKHLVQSPSADRDWEKWNNLFPSHTRNFKLKSILWRRLRESRWSEPTCSRKNSLQSRLQSCCYDTVIHFLSSSLPIY